ncbi:GFA family protein [Ovoidimarina sediminis]|uniref:GFA family protein n=1 Tax=Ovoidimarina sediminis TaxID=3079856 RepID=UPI00290E5E8C|nr:GFA family protein [Rhodophyticola sp. MJ-SS7]MDU8945037.1 GFA family protein [Rhodophyticola sp. MJ-SS7]
MTEHKASCPCGALSLTASEDPLITIACSCRACQKRTGSAFATVAYIAKSAVEVTGPRQRWGRTAASGRGVENVFCPTCGTTLYWTLDFRPDHMGILVGAFDTEKPTPTRAVWTCEKLPWVEIPGGWEAFGQGSPGS